MGDVSIHPDQLQSETSEWSESRTAELGGYTVEFGATRAGFSMRPEVFHGLPDDACQCPHWGVLLKGEFRVPFADGRVERVCAGEAYYLPPGHRFEVVEDCEYVEFSPTAELRETYDIVSRNMDRDA